jgi:hypothetical protein
VDVSDPIRYPARPGSAEAVRQDIWRTRRDLEEALGELLSRADVKAAARRRLRALGRGLARNPATIGGTGLAVAAGAAVAAAPVVRRRWRIVAVGVLGVIAGAMVVSRRRPRIAPAATVAPANPGTLAPYEAVAAAEALELLPPGPPGGDVVTVLIEQHRQVEAAFRSVLAATEREKFNRFTALVDMLNRHEHAEQEIVHPLLERLDSAAAIAAGRLAEENVADRMLSRLISVGVEDSSFDRQLSELAEAVAKHAAAEEAQEFPLLRANIPADRLQHMANQVRAAQGEQW